jgi:ADP-ribose pyrophosphatase
MAQAKEWEVITRETVFKKYSQIIERRDYRLPNGQIADYYIRVQNSGACALAFTTDNKVITLPQYRPGPGKILRELPGGLVDRGEDPRQAAIRELLEETGYAGDVEAWTGTWHMDAYTQVNRTIVIVKNCKKVADSQLDEREFGEAELVEVAEFTAQARTGQLTDTAGAMLALDYLGLLR